MTQSFEHSLKTQSTIYICHGKQCRKSKQSHRKLCDQFPSAKSIRCVGICKGPVVLVTKGESKKSLTFFKKVRKPKTIKKLEQFMLWDRLGSKLRKKTLSDRKVKKLKKRVKAKKG